MKTRGAEAGRRWSIPDDLRVAVVDGYPLAYRDEGNGDPVLLVHGSLSDLRSWNAQIAPLAARHRVLTPSLRHCWPERWNGEGDDYTLARHADDLAGLLDQLGIARAHVVGHSRGGAVALALLHRHPRVFASLTLADPRGLEPLLADDPETARMAAEIGTAFARLRRALANADVETAARGFVDALGGPGAWDRRAPAERALFLDNIATSSDVGELPPLDRAILAALALPTLLLTGERSPPRYARMFAALRTLNPRLSAPVVVNDAAHGMQRENPVAFNAALLEFLVTAGR